MIQIDYNGIALVIGAIGAMVGSIATAILQIRSARKQDENRDQAITARNESTATLVEGQRQIHELVDGTKSELERQNILLKRAVASQATGGSIPEQPAGQGGAPVGIDKGVVTVEGKREPTQEGE